LVDATHSHSFTALEELTGDQKIEMTYDMALSALRYTAEWRYGDLNRELVERLTEIYRVRATAMDSDENEEKKEMLRDVLTWAAEKQGKIWQSRSPDTDKTPVH
jgi:hypothetical protein